MRPEMEELQQRVAEQFRHIDETVLVVLKGHLLIEEALDAIISKFVHHAAFVEEARLRFAQKVAIARSMSLDQHENGMWDIAIKLNTLRNELAHALESPKRAGKTQAVIDVYFREIETDEHREVIRNQPEHIVLILAVSFFLGFLSNFQAEVDRFRQYLSALDVIVNPHRYEAAAAPDGKNRQ